MLLFYINNYIFATMAYAKSRVDAFHIHSAFLALSLQVVALQFFSMLGRTQLFQGLGLNLANALTGNAKLFTNLIQGTLAAIVQAKAQAQHLLLLRIELL